jgi:hypothetical protein
MTATCGHPLCALIGGSCSITAGRSRGCTPGLAEKAIAPDVFDEIRALLPRIDRRHHPARSARRSQRGAARARRRAGSRAGARAAVPAALMLSSAAAVSGT